MTNVVPFPQFFNFNSHPLIYGRIWQFMTEAWIRRWIHYFQAYVFTLPLVWIIVFEVASRIPLWIINSIVHIFFYRALNETGAKFPVRKINLLIFLLLQVYLYAFRRIWHEFGFVRQRIYYGFHSLDVRKDLEIMANVWIRVNLFIFRNDRISCRVKRHIAAMESYEQKTWLIYFKK